MSNVVSIKQSATEKPTTLTKAHEQWRERPADQRYESLQALLTATRDHKARSIDAHGRLRDFKVLSSGNELYIEGKTKQQATPTHWAFTQLCARAKAPAGYLRELPTDLAAKALSHGLANAEETKDGSFLLRRGAGGLELCCATSDRYVRVWNHEIAETLCELESLGLGWQFPEPYRRPGTAAGSEGARGQKAAKQVPIAFASDHDMFAFMVNYARPIDLDGQLLSRGFFIENSEVGARAVKLTMFLFDFVCGNIMVWGARNVQEVSISHIGSVRKNVLDVNGNALKMLSAYADTAESEQIADIRAAQKLLLGETQTEVVGKLFGRRELGLSKKALNAAFEVAKETPRYGDPHSAWAMINGLTEVSQRGEYTDERIDLDRAAGKILKMAF